MWSGGSKGHTNLSLTYAYAVRRVSLYGVCKFTLCISECAGDRERGREREREREREGDSENERHREKEERARDELK